MATLGMADDSILRTCMTDPAPPSLLYTSELMLFVKVVRCSSIFEMVLIQKMLRIRRKE